MHNYGLLDTSVVIAVARAEGPKLPEQAFISIMTIAELQYGVRWAQEQKDEKRRSERAAVVQMASQNFAALPVDGLVALHYGYLMATARVNKQKPKVADALIAATASAYSLPLYARDDDFKAFESDVEVVWA